MRGYVSRPDQDERLEPLRSQWKRKKRKKRKQESEPYVQQCRAFVQAQKLQSYLCFDVDSPPYVCGRPSSEFGEANDPKVGSRVEGSKSILKRPAGFCPVAASTPQ